MSVLKVIDWSKFKCKSLSKAVYLGEGYNEILTIITLNEL